MKKLLKKVFKKKEKLPVRDQVAILISRLTDPTDILYDENFAKGFDELYACRKQR